MDAAIVKISSKGQLVLPVDMRRNFKLGRGSKVMVLQQGGSIVLKSLDAMGGDIDEELHMMQRAAAGWGEIAAGRAKKQTKAEFLAELKSW